MQMAAKIKNMERQQDTDLMEKEKEAAISLQREHRKGFNCIQNNTPELSSSVNARTEPNVEMEERGVRAIHNAVKGREKDREAEKECPNCSNNKGKSKDVSVDNKEEQLPSHHRHTPKPKSTGCPTQAQAGTWNNIKHHKTNAATKSCTFLHAQVVSSFDIICSCSRNAQLDVNDDGMQDNKEDEVMENKHHKLSGQRTDDDDDSEVLDSDEGDNRLSAHKLKKMMVDIMHDVLDEKSPHRSRLQSKMSKALRDEKKLDKKWERKSFCVSHYVDGNNLIQIWSLHRTLFVQFVRKVLGLSSKRTGFYKRYLHLRLLNNLI